METARQAVRRVAGEAVLSGAKAEILKALRNGAAQVIYFAQDKNFLSDLAGALASEDEVGSSGVAVLDSSVPGHRRKKLVDPGPPRQVKGLPDDLVGGAGGFPSRRRIASSPPSPVSTLKQLSWKSRS
jgi:hypothetical protein